MLEQRLFTISTNDNREERLFPKSSGEASMLMIGSIVWPMIDTYYIALITALSMVKKKDSQEANFVKDCQFIGETLHADGMIQYFESCNQPSINNAKAALIQMKVFTKRSDYISLSGQYSKKDGEKQLRKIIQDVGQFRMKPTSQTVLDEFNSEVSDLRRTVLHDFPIMAKL